MNKLNVIIVSERTMIQNMGGCGKNHPQLCGARDCSYNGGSREN